MHIVTNGKTKSCADCGQTLDKCKCIFTDKKIVGYFNDVIKPKLSKRRMFISVYERDRHVEKTKTLIMDELASIGVQPERISFSFDGENLNVILGQKPEPTMFNVNYELRRINAKSH